MSRIDNYNPLLAAATVLTIAILVTFQLYMMREPTRMQAEAASDLAVSVIEGNALYGANCASCHGVEGEGSIGPSLRTEELLESVSEGQLIGLVKTGVPGTGMPAWSQAYGGPFTDEEVRHVITYITTWEPLELDEAEELSVTDVPSEPQANGSTLYATSCAACHGLEGEGGIGTSLQSNAFVQDQTDEALIGFIFSGRPGTGMPGFQGRLPAEDVQTIITLLRTW